MKQSKAKKSVPAPSAATQAAAQPLLPDAEYVAQLLAASTPEPASDSASISSSAVEVEAATMASDAVSVADSGTELGLLSLDAQCLLRDVSDCRLQLLKRLESETTRIDVAAVERIDTAYMQVLLTFIRSRPATLAAVTWLNVNAVFLEAAEALGLRSALGLPINLDSALDLNASAA